MGLIRPTEGVVYINKNDVSKWSTQSLANKVSAVFQNFGKYKLTLRENVMLNANLVLQSRIKNYRSKLLGLVCKIGEAVLFNQNGDGSQINKC